jgi:hypothetical protein
MKKGPLSRNEKTYILKNIENGVIKIAEGINRTQECVRSFLNDIGMPYTEESVVAIKHEEEVKKIEDSQPEQPTIMSNMGVFKKGSGIVVMTEGAASLSDAKRVPKSMIPEKFIMSNHKNGTINDKN